MGEDIGDILTPSNFMAFGEEKTQNIPGFANTGQTDADRCYGVPNILPIHFFFGSPIRGPIAYPEFLFSIL